MAPQVYSYESDNCLRYDKLPTTQAQFAPTLPQTAQYARQTTYNTGSDRSHLPQTAQYARQTTYNTGSDRSHLPQTA